MVPDGQRAELQPLLERAVMQFADKSYFSDPRYTSLWIQLVSTTTTKHPDEPCWVDWSLADGYLVLDSSLILPPVYQMVRSKQYANSQRNDFRKACAWKSS